MWIGDFAYLHGRWQVLVRIYHPNFSWPLIVAGYLVSTKCACVRTVLSSDLVVGATGRISTVDPWFLFLYLNAMFDAVDLAVVGEIYFTFPVAVCKQPEPSPYLRRSFTRVHCMEWPLSGLLPLILSFPFWNDVEIAQSSCENSVLVICSGGGFSNFQVFIGRLNDNVYVWDAFYAFEVQDRIG